jgi:hypothetical protein
MVRHRWLTGDKVHGLACTTSGDCNILMHTALTKQSRPTSHSSVPVASLDAGVVVPKSPRGIQAADCPTKSAIAASRACGARRSASATCRGKWSSCWANHTCFGGCQTELAGRTCDRSCIRGASRTHVSCTAGRTRRRSGLAVPPSWAQSCGGIGGPRGAGIPCGANATAFQTRLVYVVAPFPWPTLEAPC